MNKCKNNMLSTFGLIKRDDIKINNRAKLDTGTHCNYNCFFCYYKESLNVKTELNIIKGRINYLLENGITEIDLSGGESSIHKNWFEILDYCNDKFENISTLSNGSMFCNLNFLQKSKDHGLKEVLFSLHGFNEQSHDEIVGKKGAFKRIITAIENCLNIGILVRINCTISEKNYLHLNEYVKLLNSFKNIFELNFLPLNYWSDAKNLKKIDYNEFCYYIKEAIIKLKDSINKINVRYVPFCFFTDFEEHVCGIYQHIYDTYDWNIAMYDTKNKFYDYQNNKLNYLFSIAAEKRLHSYWKPEACKKCKFYNICDGLEKGLEIEVHPLPGNKVKDVIIFREKFYEDI